MEDNTLSEQGDTRFCTTDLGFCRVTVAQRTSSTPRSSALQNPKSEAQNSFGPQVPYFGGWQSNGMRRTGRTPIDVNVASRQKTVLGASVPLFTEGMNAELTAEKILQEVGGEKNIQNLTHCMTRLRFSLHSMEGVDEAKVKQIPGVMGVVNKGGQFQVLIGQKVPVVFAEIQKLGDFDGTSGKGTAPEQQEDKKKGLNLILDTLAGIFSPIMHLIAGTGMVKALLSILALFSLIGFRQCDQRPHRSVHCLCGDLPDPVEAGV